MSLISCKNLAVGYGNEVVAKNITFNVDKGMYLCIIGENGVGKSTLIKTILGLNRELDGQLVFSDEIIKEGIGYLPQNTFVRKDFPATVKEIVLTGTLASADKFRLFYSKADRQRAQKAMELLGIEDIGECCFRNLSGGQCQRVLLARALCSTDRLLLLDEPVAGLDPAATENFYEIVSKLNKNGTAVIMVSHDLAAVDEFATHVMFLGRTDFFFGTKAAYKETEISSLWRER
ncbi:MAG: metal ABC transporter ATP-binding protein [Clostridiales bacterium]|nr:metal ABC transporter ATP-binding protein [Clostridiales bacterium]